MASPRVIALDLGGTKLLSGVVDDGGVVEKRVVGATDTSSEDAVLAQVEEAVEGLLEEDIGAIGVGIPSTIDQRRGEAIDSVNIPLSDVPLRDRLGERFGAARRDRERRECGGARGAPARSRPRIASHGHAHPRDGGGGRPHPRRQSLPRRDRRRSRARPHHARPPRASVPGSLSRTRPSRGAGVGHGRGRLRPRGRRAESRRGSRARGSRGQDRGRTPGRRPRRARSRRCPRRALSRRLSPRRGHCEHRSTSSTRSSS